jgi:hypothetical protein
MAIGRQRGKSLASRPMQQRPGFWEMESRSQRQYPYSGRSLSRAADERIAAADSISGRAKGKADKAAMRRALQESADEEARAIVGGGDRWWEGDLQGEARDFIRDRKLGSIGEAVSGLAAPVRAVGGAMRDVYQRATADRPAPEIDPWEGEAPLGAYSPAREVGRERGYLRPESIRNPSQGAQMADAELDAERARVRGLADAASDRRLEQDAADEERAWQAKQLQRASPGIIGGIAGPVGRMGEFAMQAGGDAASGAVSEYEEGLDRERRMAEHRAQQEQDRQSALERTIGGMNVGKAGRISSGNIVYYRDPQTGTIHGISKGSEKKAAAARKAGMEGTGTRTPEQVRNMSLDARFGGKDFQQISDFVDAQEGGLEMTPETLKMLTELKALQAKRRQKGPKV